MAVVEINKKAPDFSMIDQKGNEISLADFVEIKNVVLVLNRGFV